MKDHECDRGKENDIDPLSEKLKLISDQWKVLNLKLLGKINTIKMLVAPQFSYISMMIPINISNVCLEKI